MKFCAFFFLASATRAQLLGFGATCPIVEVDITNLDFWCKGSIFAVVHSPMMALIDMSRSPPHSDVFSLLDNDYDHSFLSDDFGVDNSFYVCGEEGSGYQIINLAEDEAVCGSPSNLFESLESFTLAPKNTGLCSCGDMRISLLVAADNEFFTNAVFLDRHKLASVSEPSWTYAKWIGASQFDGRGVLMWASLTFDAEYIDIPLNQGSTDAVLVEFTPMAGSSDSTSFLSLWALLMHGWY